MILNPCQNDDDINIEMIRIRLLKWHQFKINIVSIRYLENNYDLKRVKNKNNILTINNGLFFFSETDILLDRK